ncbi:hypothetical protein [Actinoplanes sp. NPDC049265]|uniref:hypothetical protein n=1 Tax=Actinoplanes sp. NPDC049265 TaxID=3363902 RepID=UPI00371165B6
MLVHCLAEQESRGKPDPDAFTRTMSEFDRLPRPRREEIRRHLDMILAGGIQDQIDAEYASELEANRTGNRRRERAWKFFWADPATPVRREPKKVALNELTWFLLVLGVALCAAAFVLLVPVVAEAGTPPVVTALLLCSGGGFLAVRCRWETLRQRERYRRVAARQKPISSDSGNPGGDGRSRANILVIRALVDAAFEAYRPRKKPDGEHWDRSVKRIKNAVQREIVDLYGRRKRLDRIVWLIMWHAKVTFDRWSSGSLPDDRTEPRAAGRTVLLTVLGLVAGGGGFCVVVAEIFVVDWPVTILAVPLLCLGASLTYRGATMFYLEVGRRREELGQADSDYARQYAAYEEHRRELADRPDDSEMARWLDYDKAHVRQLAMRRYRLTSRDVLAHTILTEARPPCARARVVSGPPRYSRYIIRVFLLTEGGVRQFAVESDFLTGMIGNEERTAFHYGAFASARVKEFGMRLGGGRSAAKTATPRPTDSPGHRPVGDALVLSRTFELALVNDQLIKVRAENFDEGLIDRVREDPRNLLELALDVAGINGALQILESVAAEGKDWIERERRRRDRRLRNYQQGVDPGNALPPAAPDARRARASSSSGA